MSYDDLSSLITEKMKLFITPEFRRRLLEIDDGRFLGYTLKFPKDLQDLINEYKIINNVKRQ